jgi:hypothetical protein
MCHFLSVAREESARTMTETSARSEAACVAARIALYLRSVRDSLVNRTRVSDASAIALRHWWTSGAVPRECRDSRKEMEAWSTDEIEGVAIGRRWNIVIMAGGRMGGSVVTGRNRWW